MLNTQIIIMAVVALVLLLAVVLYIVQRNHKRKNADKLQMKIREDEKLHITLDDKSDAAEVARIILEGLGGRENVSEVQHDGARLKVAIRQYDAVDEKKIRSAQVGGVLRPGKNAVQIIIGPSVEPVENELHKLLGM